MKCMSLISAVRLVTVPLFTSTEAKLLISITDKPSQRPGNKSLTYICYSVVYKTIHFLSLR